MTSYSVHVVHLYDVVLHACYACVRVSASVRFAEVLLSHRNMNDNVSDLSGR